MLEKTLILGFGTTGKSFVDYLLSQDQQIKIYDSKLEKIPNMILKNKNIEFFQDIVPDNILDNVFQVFISPGFNPQHQIMKMINDKKLDIFIKHPKHDPRPLEMGSGAEKTIASMAIRLAFLTVSSLPKSDLFILDEPGTALDEENMEGFVRILDMVKGYFKTVLLISHLDTLKDCVDMQISIERKDGYAHVNI